MAEYRRAWLPGATWFFTVNLAERRGNRLLGERIDVLRTAFRYVRVRHPFHLEAIVILPDHLHCVWTLAPGDTDFSSRWSSIKGHFSRAIEKGERISQSRAKRGERGLWQRRFWEHHIRDQADFNRHVDYVHWNPVKHGWVRRVADWPHSSFHAFRRRGIYPEDWGGENVPTLAAGE
jgi:putative transposase